MLRRGVAACGDSHTSTNLREQIVRRGGCRQELSTDLASASLGGPRGFHEGWTSVPNSGSATGGLGCEGQSPQNARASPFS